MQQNQDKFLDFLRCVIIGYIPANISNNFQHTHAISYRHNIIITGREMYNFFLFQFDKYLYYDSGSIAYQNNNARNLKTVTHISVMNRNK